MVVLSLFDGMSCGQIALKELGIHVERYYASEIDKNAIKQTQLNFPDTIQLGDVEHWREWNIDWSSIDLIIGGSPCQGFSFAGKQLAFDDPRSRLFFVYVDILNHIKEKNPKVKFLLENVLMKKEFVAVINNCLGIQPVMINSSLVSAQNRKRLYWSNLRTATKGLFLELHTDIPLPEDKHIYIQDILEENVEQKYFLSDTGIKWIVKHAEKRNSRLNIVNNKKKGSTLTVSTTTKRYNLGTDFVMVGTYRTFKEDKGFRPLQGYKSGTIAARAREDGSGQPVVLLKQGNIRRLTPTECARLQTIPAWYKWQCSDTQQYKMLGNGWTVEVIKHILSYI